MRKILNIISKLFSCRVLAFTLAETLVVMGIIGVVAALTIPNLNQSTGDKEKVAKVKKVYANLEDALGRATAVYGPIEDWFVNDDEETANERLASRLSEFLKVSKNCETGSGCFADSKVKRLNGAEDSSYTDNDYQKIILADGTSVAFYISDTACSYENSGVSNVLPDGTCGGIDIDIDGVKGANTLGKDIFFFDVTKNGIIPTGSYLEDDPLALTCFLTGGSCTGWVIKTGNMDYLKLKTSGTGVNSKFECPNGNKLTWDNSSCN